MLIPCHARRGREARRDLRRRDRQGQGDRPGGARARQAGRAGRGPERPGDRQGERPGARAAGEGQRAAVGAGRRARAAGQRRPTRRTDGDPDENRPRVRRRPGPLRAGHVQRGHGALRPDDIDAAPARPDSGAAPAQPQPSGLKKVIGAVLPTAAAKKATPSSKKGKAGGLALVAAAAGMAFKNRGKLSELRRKAVRRHGDEPDSSRQRRRAAGHPGGLTAGTARADARPAPPGKLRWRGRRRPRDRLQGARARHARAQRPTASRSGPSGACRTTRASTSSTGS